MSTIHRRGLAPSQKGLTGFLSSTAGAPRDGEPDPEDAPLSPVTNNVHQLTPSGPSTPNITPAGFTTSNHNSRPYSPVPHNMRHSQDDGSATPPDSRPQSPPSYYSLDVSLPSSSRPSAPFSPIAKRSPWYARSPLTWPALGPLRHYQITLPAAAQELFGNGPNGPPLKGNRTPGAFQRRKWKVFLFYLFLTALSVLAIVKAARKDWRMASLTRVDPYPVLPAAFLHGSRPSTTTSPHEIADDAPPPPVYDAPTSHTFKPDLSVPMACPAAHGEAIPIPNAYFPTPPDHPHHQVGHYFSIMNPDRCLTYEGRLGMYNDQALDVKYRLGAGKEREGWEDKVLEEEGAGQSPEVDDTYGFDDDNKTLSLKVETEQQKKERKDRERKGRAWAKSSLTGLKTLWKQQVKAQQALGIYSTASSSSAGTGSKGKYSDSDYRAHLLRTNQLAEVLGPDSWPDWWNIMQACHQTADAKVAAAQAVTNHFKRADEHDAEPEPERDVEFDAEDPYGTYGGGKRSSNKAKVARTAIVLRSYEGFIWREDDVLNLRALINEVSLHQLPTHQWTVHILMEVHSPYAIFTSEAARLELLSKEVPREFWGLVELWSTPQLCALYPGLGGRYKNGMIAQSSYRACLMAVQKFSLDHPEYDYVWNWEMDARYIGDYAELFRATEAFAREEPLDIGMIKYAKWQVLNDTRSEANWAYNASKNVGRGVEADMITYNPIFDPRASGWYWEHDVQGYPMGRDTDRRAAIGTNMRLSRALLDAMSNINAESKRSMHCEGWPTTVVHHSHLKPAYNNSFPPHKVYTQHYVANKVLPFKGVYAPIPVYFRHIWDPEVLASRINSHDFYRPSNEVTMRDSSFYYDGKHSRELYLGWKDRKGVCRNPVLLHPVKHVD